MEALFHVIILTILNRRVESWFFSETWKHVVPKKSVETVKLEDRKPPVSLFAMFWIFLWWFLYIKHIALQRANLWPIQQIFFLGTQRIVIIKSVLLPLGRVLGRCRLLKGNSRDQWWVFKVGMENSVSAPADIYRTESSREEVIVIMVVIADLKPTVRLF